MHHPEGPILIDTGVGVGSALIDRLYSPVRHSLDAALETAGSAIDDIRLVVLTHLHFDHCGQANRFAAVPIVVQRAEVEAARTPRYTVAEWAEPPGAVLRIVDGECEVAAGVRVVPTPGHTPGHQSVVIDGADGPTVVAGQGAWNAAAYAAGDLGDDGWDQTAGRASLAAIRALDPVTVYFSHDPAMGP